MQSSLSLPEPLGIGQRIARWLLRLMGWRLVGTPPSADKYLVIAAHHTSTWDFPLGILVWIGLGVSANFAAKDDLFRSPLGWLMRALGGIPVNRRARTSFVQQMIDAYNQRERMVLVISPEGTRSHSPYWRSGFYHIALGAKLPVVLGFLDFERKVGGFGPTLHLTGDVDADLARIAEFYDDVKGRHPERHTPIRFRPEGEEARPQKN